MKLYIGIDTGRDTGFAVWGGGQLLRVETTTIVHAMAEILDYLGRWEDVHLVFEDARQRKWIPRERSNSEYRGKLMGAGSVKRDGEIWEEFCKEYDIPFRATPPKNNTTKLTAETFRQITGWTGRTSEHARDAAMLVFGK